MAKKQGSLCAIYQQTSAGSSSATGSAMAQVGSTLWYAISNAARRYWDKAKAITIYDGVTDITATILEWDYAFGAVRLASAPVGSVTADHYYFASAQVAGFKSFSIDENMSLEECGCFEDTGEVYEATYYSAGGSGNGFYTTTDSTFSMAKGDNKDLTLTSRLIGTAGDAISFEIVVAGSNTALSVSVVGSDIVVNSATGGGGAATSTATAIRDALEASAAAMALVKVKLKAGSDGTGIPGAQVHTHLAGGVNPAPYGDVAAGSELIGIFYWDSGASLIQTGGVIVFENVSLNTAKKALVGKTLRWKSVGMMYDHSG